MNQNRKGIISTQKNTHISHVNKRKIDSSQAKKIQNHNGSKEQINLKQNPVSPQTQQSTEFDKDKKEYKNVNLCQNKKLKVNAKQFTAFNLKSSKNNDYVMENSEYKLLQKPKENNQKIDMLKKVKHQKDSLNKSGFKQKSQVTKLKSPLKINLLQKKSYKINQYIKNLSGQTTEKDTTYKQSFQKNQSTQKKSIKLRRNNSISSTSSQNSYYGIVAEYRRKRLQKSTQFSQEKLSLENSVTQSIQLKPQKAPNSTKSVQQYILKPFLNDKYGNKNDLKYGFRPRQGTSVSSKSSIKSSRSNFSNSSRNKIEEKVLIMKNHLRQRKGSINSSRKNSLNRKESPDVEDEYRVKHINQNQGDKEKQVYFQKKNQVQLLDYKQLYQKSINKLKTVTKQLEVQKKKNEMTKQIHKSEIQKLKRQKSSQNIMISSLNQNEYNNNNQTQNQSPFIINLLGSERIQNKNDINEQKINNQNSIIDLKSKLKSSHLFTYEACQSIMKTRNPSSEKKTSFGQIEQKSTNSILMPNQQHQRHEQNETHDMIVELSEELKQSDFRASSLWKSKMSDKLKVHDFIKSSREKNLGQNESMLLPELSFNKNNQFIEGQQISFNQLDNLQIYKNQLKQQSLLLDLSSNFNNTKSFRVKDNQLNNQQQILLDSYLENSEFKTANLIEVENQDEKKVQKAQQNEFLSQDIVQNIKKKDDKKIPTKKYFAEDYQNQYHTTNLQSQYDSTSSSTVMKNKNNIKKTKIYFYD